MAGVIPNIFTVSAVIFAIIARSFGDGSIFIEVSEKNKGPLFVIIRFVVATLLIPLDFPIVSITGLNVAG